MSHLKDIKQILIDLAVTILFPALLLWGYYSWRGDDAIFINPAGNDMTEAIKRGERVKRALAEIESVNFDASIFDDPVFRALEYYPVDVGTTTFGREFPFLLPESIELLKKQRGSY